jgi:hypothetical protein
MRVSIAWFPVVLAMGCSSGHTAGTERTESAGQAVISDQFHSGGTKGFVWLPPMVPAPDKIGGLVANVPVMVRVDETNPDGSTRRTLAMFTRTSGPEGAKIRFYGASSCDEDDDDGDADNEGYYLARWDTDDFNLSTSATYRAHVLVPAKGGGQRELGFADVAVVRSTQQFKSVDRTEFTPLINGRMLRIKFRVDQPAVDQDGDGVFDWIDDCPTVFNPDQKDSLHNRIGDACRCLPVKCAALDACHTVGVCQPTTGTCTSAPDLGRETRGERIERRHRVLPGRDALEPRHHRVRARARSPLRVLKARALIGRPALRPRRERVMSFLEQLH